MKKVLSLLSLILLMVVMVSCGEEKKPEAPKEMPSVTLSSKVRVLTPGGMPYVALGGLLFNDNIEITVADGPKALAPALMKGEYDIIVAPVNLGAQKFNEGSLKYVVSHIITGNNAYIVSKTELNSFNDLAGKEVLAFGKEASLGIPGTALKKAYEMNSLDIANVKFNYDSSANVYTNFKAPGANYALMSEPEISKMIINDKADIKTLDLKTVLGTDFAQACVYVNPNSTNSEDVNKVLTLMGEMNKVLNEDTEFYVDSILPLDRMFNDAYGKEVLVRCIPLSNIVFKDAKANKEYIENTLNLLGIPLPTDAFYR